MSAEPVTDTPVAEPTAVEPTAVEPTAVEPAAETAAAPTETEAPAAAAEPTSETAAAAPVTDAKEEKVEESAAKTEAAPMTEGVLGYKAPGLIKSLRFSKKFFWLGDEAVSDSALRSYVSNEKPEVAHKNAAFASQTGKGLLLFAKRAEDKTAPAGILNLGEATDLTKEETLDFSLKLGGHKHTFQASSKAERDSWFLAVEKASAEAKTAHESVTSSEGYKNKLDKYTKPFGIVAGAGSAAAATKAVKSEDKVHDGTAEGNSSAVATAETPKPKTDTKSRSQSRKRQSIFGTILGKKEQLEEKKEIKKEEKAEKKEEKEEAKEEKKEEKAEKKEEAEPAKEETKTDEEAAAVATGAAAGAAVAAEESKPAATEAPKADAATTSKPKRGSVFGRLFSQGKEDKKEAAPAVPAKDVAPVAAEAPQLDPVDAAAPIETSAPAVTEPAVEPAKDTKDGIPFTDITAGATSSGTSPKKEEGSKGGILGFFKAKEAAIEAKIEEKKEEKTADKEEVADKTETAAPAETETPAAPAAAAAPETAAAPVTTPSPAAKKDKRRSGFFESMSGSRARKSETSDAEGTDGEKKSKGIGGLLRRVSRSAKPTTGPVTDSSAPPAIAKDVDPTTDAAPATEEAAPVTNGATNGATETETAAKPAEPLTNDAIAEPADAVPTTTTAAPVTASA